MNKRASCLPALLLVFLLPGCGYHTAGHAVQLPENVKTIAVPPFKNETLTYRIGQSLTSSVVREFTGKTRATVSHRCGDGAAIKPAVKSPDELSRAAFARFDATNNRLLAVFDLSPVIAECSA